MTKLIEYKCNFCHGTHFDKAEIFGAHWQGSGENEKLHLIPKEKSENHLCMTCINAISAAKERGFEK